MPLYNYTQPSKSLADRIYTAEFDDALLDQVAWKNARYDGCKVISKEINKYTPIQTASNSETGIGFASVSYHGATLGHMMVGGNGLSNFTVGGIYSIYPNLQPQSNLSGIFKVGNFIPKVTWPGDTINPTGLNPNLKRETTAIYISNTVIGGTEDDQFTTIKNHSYINIHQILLIDSINDTVQLLDKQAESFIPFHSFITNDLPTGDSFSISLIDESISNNLKGQNQYKVKMNKGFLLKTFEFQTDTSATQLQDNNSIYLYTGGNKETEYIKEGATQSNPQITNDKRTRFKYGVVEPFSGNIPGFGIPGSGHMFTKDIIGPSFASSSIVENKFTQQYYSGSYGLINEPTQPQGVFNEDILKTSGLGSASRFIGINSLDFLVQNNEDPILPIQSKTELHLTLFEGTKDFSSGSNDERSISTFEIDINQSPITLGTTCQDFLPTDHELFLKGMDDDRFKPKINTFKDDILNGYLTSSVVAGGCVTQGSYDPTTDGIVILQRGISADFTDEADIYVQGGVLGDVGYQGAVTSSNTSLYGKSLSGSMTQENYYSGSFSYQLSFLDKDHTLITNLDKNAELFDGIGTKGIVIIPENTKPIIKNNIKHYLKLAGIIDSSPNSAVLISNDTK
tara:strand:- start:58 stop:1932 length:1875 start_codon:yes stop_codon:yes gene_type:complete